MNVYYIAVSITGLICLIFLTIGTALLSGDSQKRKKYTGEATARVKELKKKQTGKPGTPGSIRYYPVFEYRANGQFIRTESKVGSDKPPYKEGDELTIYFNPDARHEFYIPGSKSVRILGTVLTAIGILLAVVGLGMIYSFRQ